MLPEVQIVSTWPRGERRRHETSASASATSKTLAPCWIGKQYAVRAGESRWVTTQRRGIGDIFTRAAEQLTALSGSRGGPERGLPLLRRLAATATEQYRRMDRWDSHHTVDSPTPD